MFFDRSKSESTSQSIAIPYSSCKHLISTLFFDFINLANMSRKSGEEIEETEVDFGQMELDNRILEVCPIA